MAGDTGRGKSFAWPIRGQHHAENWAWNYARVYSGLRAIQVVAGGRGVCHHCRHEKISDRESAARLVLSRFGFKHAGFSQAVVQARHCSAAAI